MKQEFLVKDRDDFKLRVSIGDCKMPVGLRELEFVNEQYRDGELVEKSTYQFFLTQEEILSLSQGLRS